MENKIFYSGLLIFSLASQIIFAREDVNKPKTRTHIARNSSGCAAPGAFAELNVNNVRCRINSGGDMHWDLVGEARYEIPKVFPPNPSVNSVFASAIWVGGYDGTNLKIAAQTYRQSGGTDYYTGPLDTTTCDITAANCSKWDNLFTVYKDTIDNFITAWNNGQIQSGAYPVALAISQWPAHGTGNEAYYLAPFHDEDGDGFYDPQNDGDYPVLRCDGMEFIPDQFIWWVMNDKGNIHYETGGGNPIGLEIQAAAFAYNTTDEINDMTFYQYKIINRCTSTLDNTYFAFWVDTDIGCFQDDYVGCDTVRGIGYCYNGDNNDASCGSNGYGTSIPIIGVDFFRGPKDQFGNLIPMTKFFYYENTSSPCCGNPNLAIDYYRYMSGYWLDGTRWVDDYNQCSDGKAEGYNAGCTAYTNFLFPGNPYTATGWTESNAGNTPFDRHILESAGSFKLLPGAQNELILGYVWARGIASAVDGFPQFFAADDKAQSFFSSCFGAGIEDNQISQKTSVNIYPNPFTTTATVSVSHAELGSASQVFRNKFGMTFTMYDLQGRRVKQFTVQNSTCTINRENLSGGMYLYEVRDKEGVIGRGKLVIQ